MKKSKLFIFGLVSTCVLGLIGCGNSSSSSQLTTTKPTTTASTTEPFNYVRPTKAPLEAKIQEMRNAVTSNNGAAAAAAYKEADEYVESIRTTKIKMIDEFINASEIRLVDELYWECKSDLIIEAQTVLASTCATDFKTGIGETFATNLGKIDVSKMFINRQYVKPEETIFSAILDKMIEKCTDVANSQEVWNLFVKFEEEFEKINAYYSILYVRGDLDSKNSYYVDELVFIENLLNNGLNDYQKTLEIVLQSVCKDIFIQNMGQDEVDDFLSNVEVYSPELMAIQNRITELENSYSSLTSPNDQKLLYVQLVKLRNQFTQKLCEEFPSKNYKNYEEYAFSEVYNRDYTPEQAITMTENMASASTSNWNALISDMPNLKGSVNEEDLWDALSYTVNVSDEVTDVMNYMRDYGLYNFDVRDEKYTGSYVISNGHYEDSYMFLGTTGTYSDYSTAFHEFGHYFANNVADPEQATLSSRCLDLAEINSQGLEFLMMEYYTEFVSKNNAKKMKKEQMINGLWSVFSGSAIFALEHFAYNYDGELTVDILTQEMKAIKGKYNLSNFVLDFSSVPHVFQSPCYYISYVTSVIPAMELWTLEHDEAVKIYMDMAHKGNKNPFLQTLENVGLSNIFTNASIYNTINTKISIDIL